MTTNQTPIRVSWKDFPEEDQSLTISEIIDVYQGDSDIADHPDNFHLGIMQALEVADFYDAGQFDDESDLIVAALHVLAAEIRRLGIRNDVEAQA